MTEPSLLKTTIVVMGVAGSGKSTVAGELAERLGWPMAEGDDFHSPPRTGPRWPPTRH